MYYKKTIYWGIVCMIVIKLENTGTFIIIISKYMCHQCFQGKFSLNRVSTNRSEFT